MQTSYAVIMNKMCRSVKGNLNFFRKAGEPGGEPEIYVKPRHLPRPVSLLLAEGHAVSALVLSGVTLVGAHQNLVQRAVVGVLGVMGAGLDGALDAFVGIHKNDLLKFGFCGSITGIERNYTKELAKSLLCRYNERAKKQKRRIYYV